jgi:hypothetical protein
MFLLRLEKTKIGFFLEKTLFLNLYFNLSRKDINYYLTLLPYFICVTKFLDRTQVILVLLMYSS